LIIKASNNRYSHLHLEAKEDSSGRIFAVSIDNDAISQITDGLFDSAGSLAQGLRDAASGSFPELKITIDSQGKLTYTMSFSMGTRKREDTFSINLAEKDAKTDPQMSNQPIGNWKEEHERRMNRLEDTVQCFQAKNEGRLNKLENMILKMEERMNQRFDLLGRFYTGVSRDPFKMEMRIPVVGCFNNQSINKFRYDYSSNDTTVRLLPGIVHYPCLDITPQIPERGQHSYSFKINTEQGAIAFGITTEINRENWNDELCNYRYLTLKGRIVGKVTKKSDSKGPFGGPGKIVKMVVDMDRGILTFFVDEIQVNSCEIITSESYFAYVSLGAPGDSVTLI